ncbi:MAG: DegV family protein [Asgard group archaeon]|nr:DegV family protein [Asgard group archaeon]
MSNKKKKLGIVADSTCDMDPKFLKKFDIITVPLKVIFGEDEVRHQGEDLTNEEFYERVIGGEMPSTSAPAPKAFKIAIDKQLEKYEEVLAFSIGNKLSATFSVLSMVKKQFYADDDRVTIIDTNTLSITMSLIILPVARMIEKGATKEEVLEFINKTVPHTQVFGGAATLKYLRKGGRLSRVNYLIGSVLSLTPLISVDEGLVVSPGKVKGLDSALERIRMVANKIAENRMSELVIVGHCANPTKAQEVYDYFKSLPNAPKDLQLWEIGPVIGTHLGPGTVGIVWVGDIDYEWFKVKRDFRFWKTDSKEG